MSRVPRIRFKGFEEDWEQRKLGEIVDVCNGRDYKHLLEGDIPVYGTGGYMISVNKALSYDRDAIGIGRKGTIDKPYILNAPFWTVDTLFYVIPKDKIALIFAFGIFQNIDWEKKDESTGVPSLSKAAINEIDVLIPKYEEQKVLGLFFNGLDHLITLHQRKLEKLKIIKKSMLENLFPQNGEKTPKIRFSGFTKDWEQRKLVRLCEKFTDGDWIESKDQSNFGVRLIQTGNIGLGEYIDKSNNKKWISEETFGRLNCEEVFAGDILISRLPEPAGRACIVPSLGTKIIAAVDCTIVRVATQINSKYLLQYLSSQSYFDDVNTCLAGGTRQRISRSNLADFDIPIPANYEEQKAIGEFLFRLDHLITLHQSKLEKLQKIKKSMLESMFV